jgi:hypothetical protein
VKKFFIVVILLGSMAISSYMAVTLFVSPKRARESRTKPTPAISPVTKTTKAPSEEWWALAAPHQPSITADRTVKLNSRLIFRIGRFEGADNINFESKGTVSGTRNTLLKYCNLELTYVIAHILDLPQRHVTLAPGVGEQKISVECECPENMPQDEFAKGLLKALDLEASISEKDVEALRVSARGELKSLAPESAAPILDFKHGPTGTTIKFGNHKIKDVFERIFAQYDNEFLFADGIENARVAIEITYTSPQDALEKLGDILNVRYEPTTKKVKTLYIHKP